MKDSRTKFQKWQYYHSCTFFSGLFTIGLFSLFFGFLVMAKIVLTIVSFILFVGSFSLTAYYMFERSKYD